MLIGGDFKALIEELGVGGLGMKKAKHFEEIQSTKTGSGG